jgi:hypothetical protein
VVQKVIAIMWKNIKIFVFVHFYPTLKYHKRKSILAYSIFYSILCYGIIVYGNYYFTMLYYYSIIYFFDLTYYMQDDPNVFLIYFLHFHLLFIIKEKHVPFVDHNKILYRLASFMVDRPFLYVFYQLVFTFFTYFFNNMGAKWFLGWVIVIFCAYTIYIIIWIFGFMAWRALEKCQLHFFKLFIYYIIFFIIVYFEVYIKIGEFLGLGSFFDIFAYLGFGADSYRQDMSVTWFLTCILYIFHIFFILSNTAYWLTCDIKAYINFRNIWEERLLWNFPITLWYIFVLIVSFSFLQSSGFYTITIPDFLNCYVFAKLNIIYKSDFGAICGFVLSIMHIFIWVVSFLAWLTGNIYLTYIIWRRKW